MKTLKTSALTISAAIAISATAIAKPAEFVQAEVTPQTQVTAAKAVINRITPKIAGNFQLEIIESDNGQDVFELESSPDGKIIIRGNSGVSLASGYNHYLKKYCHAMVSWCGNQLSIPKPLPQVTKKERITCLHKHRVYFNYCTLNYTASWWNWERWEREIDFMAMNGINTPLSVIGLEGAWYYTLINFGFSDKEAREFLVGPTYSAWQWMTNIEGHGGPLPKEWIDARIELGRKILTRQRALGMTPIQQGFTGYVPRLLKNKYPNANIVLENRWVGFPSTAQLDPLDPLFSKLGTAFLKTEKYLFGTSHIYAADPFHEGHPPKPGNEYLTKVGESIYNLINSVDPGFTWAMQAWSIRKHIACAVPKKQLLVLDLAGNRNDFWGYNYVKGQLHNFGGRVNLHGDLKNILSNPFAKTALKNQKCKGMGLFMEGIEQNPVFYEAVFDVIWRNKAVDPNRWIENYAWRRYGMLSPYANQAWHLLLNGPYRRGTSGVESSSIIAARPALNVKKSGPNAGFKIPYPPMDLVRAWNLLLMDADELQASAGYRFDIADIGRQVLSNLGQKINKEAAQAFKNGDRKLFQQRSAEFIELMRDIDRLTATTSVYNFGKWIADARSWSKNPKLQNYYEWNASMLVTIWGPENNPSIFDYSWREWSGLISTYYIPRWQKFYDYLDNLMAQGKSYTDPKKRCYGREALRANQFYSKLADWEIAWNKKHHELPASPSGDPIKISKKLLKKYKPAFERVYNSDNTNKKDKSHAKVILKWTPEIVSTKWKPLEMDISEKLDDAGTYAISFNYSSGGSRLDIKSVTLFANDREVSHDIHPGTTGNKNKDNTYIIPLKDFAFNTKYTITTTVRSDGGNKSYGTISIKKIK